MPQSEVLGLLNDLVRNHWFWTLTALWVVTLSAVHLLNAFVLARRIGVLASGALNLLTISASFLLLFVLPLWVLDMLPVPLPEQRDAFFASAALGIGFVAFARWALRRSRDST